MMQAQLATLRLIVTALIFGACVFGGTVIFSASRIGAKVMGDTVTTLAPVAVLVLMVLGTLLVGRLLGTPPADADANSLLRTYGVRVLAGAAVFEAAFILNMLAYLFSQDLIILGVALVPLVAMIVTRPSTARFDKWKAAAKRT